MHVDDFVVRGVPPAEAWRRARVVCGNPRVKREEIDDMQRLPLLDSLVRDVRYAVRVLRRTPGFTVTTVATLALVIGANAAVFSLANALLLTPLPFPDADRLALVSVEYTSPRGSSSGQSIDGATWEAIAKGPLANRAAVFTNWTAGFNLVVNQQARFADQQRVGAGFFRVLGVMPVIGREFSPEEDAVGGPAVAILSHALWARSFDADPNILGKTILLRGEPWQVIGVMPDGFRGTTTADVWTPLQPTTTGEGGGTNYAAIVRLPPGQSLLAAVAEIAPAVVGAASAAGVPPDVTVSGGLVPLQDVLSADNREPITMLGAAVLTVLLIACVNLAALLLWCGGLSLLTSLAFGLVPAWQSTRLNVQSALVEGRSRSIAGSARHWTRRGLIVSQVALGVVLLVSAGLLMRTFVNLQSLEPGFNPAGLTTTAISLLDARYPTPVEVNVLFDQSLERLRGTPGVSAAAVSLGLPYERVLNMGFKYQGEDSGRNASVMYVTPDFFRTFEIPVTRGREVLASDVPTSRPVVVVNESFARWYSKDEDVMGRVIAFAGAERVIVGLVNDVQMRPGFFVDGMVRGPIVASPTIYLPAAQINEGIVGTHIWFPPVWSVRASSPAVAAQALEQAIASVDALLPLGQIRQMAAVRASATAEQSMLMTLVGALALVALLLAAIGLHGLISHSVAERTREFGIRLALGATPGSTVRAVTLSGMTLAAIGVVLWALLAIPASSLVASVLYGVAEHDPLTYIGAAVFLLVVASIASLLPALRILRLDPATTLRN